MDLLFCAHLTVALLWNKPTAFFSTLLLAESASVSHQKKTRATDV